MLEAFTIFHEGGRVLWSKIFSGNGLDGNPINRLIQEVLIEVAVQSWMPQSSLESALVASPK
jgi:hypothetical protein